MTQPTRRKVLQSIAQGSLAVSCAPVWARATGGRGPGQDGLDALAERILETPRAACLDLALESLRAGATWHALEGAIFLAAVRAVRADPPGFASHVILETESVFQLAEAGPAAEALLPVLFHLDDLKYYKDRQEERERWELQRLERVPEWDAKEAKNELLTALERGEMEAADVAAAALYRKVGSVQTIEVLWTHGVGDLDGVGHKVIHAAHTQRAMERIGPAVEEAALRNLAIGLARPTEAWALEDLKACRDIAPELPDAWRAGRARPADSLALARSFLAADPEAARAETLEALAEGVGAETVWDAVRLAGCDLFARRPALLPVHATTVCNALAHISRASTEEQTSRVALLQAVSTIPVMRDALAQRGSIPRDESVLDQLLEDPGDALSLEEALSRPEPRRIRACAQAPGGPEPLVARMRSLLYRGAVQNHQLKYAAALFEDVRRSHPRWRSVLLSPAFGYLPSARTEATALFGRSRELIEQLG